MKKIISALLILTMIFSMVCVSASAAGIHVNMNFETMEVFTSQFIAGAFYVEDGVLFGYSEAKALQTQYDDGSGWFEDTAYTWLTYDASITLAVGDDELNDGDRYVNLVYCNDNLVYQGREEDRVQMSFTYDIQNRCFRFARGWNNTTEEEQYLPPVAREIDTDGAEFFTMGISVAKDNIRCFYNGELIFNYTDPNQLIAQEITSPFLFWQDGNFVQISNITVADQGYLFPATPDLPASSQVVDKGNDGDVTTTTNNQGGDAPQPVPTSRVENVEVTDEKGNAVTDEAGNKVTEQVVITDPPANTNPNAGVGGVGTTPSTGDATWIVIAAMVATIGCALIVKKVNVK